MNGANGKPYKLHEAIHCMEAYMQITDFVADEILQGGMALQFIKLKYGEEEHQKWLQAKDILEKAQRGDYYSCLGQIEVKSGKVISLRRDLLKEKFSTKLKFLCIRNTVKFH